MKPSDLDSLLEDALEYLAGLAADGADPPLARHRLRDLRLLHPDRRMRLLWQREDYDGSIRYDLLVWPPGDGTISLSYSPESGLPWSLRGGHRVSDRVLLRVNGITMEVGQAIACLDFLWDETALTDRLITSCLLRQELEEDPVDLTDAELQDGMDAFRRARGLLSTEATTEWMARRGLSHHDLEELVAAELTVAWLRSKVTAWRSEAYFRQNRALFDSARVATVRFPGRPEAEKFAEAVRGGGEFYGEAERAFSAGMAASGSGLFSVIHRGDLTPDVAHDVFQAPLGTVLGPYAGEAGWSVIRVLARQPAVFDEATAEFVQRRLFAEWLGERRKSARIDWHWGSVSRTATSSGPSLGIRP